MYLIFLFLFSKHHEPSQLEGVRSFKSPLLLFHNYYFLKRLYFECSSVTASSLLCIRKSKIKQSTIEEPQASGHGWHLANMNEFLFILVFCLLWKESSSRPGVESFAIPYKLVWTFSDVCQTLAVLTFLLVWMFSDVYQRQVMLTFFLVWTFSDVRQTLSSLGCGNVWIANSGFSLYWFVWHTPLSVGTSRMPACNTSHIICHV